MMMVDLIVYNFSTLKPSIIPHTGTYSMHEIDFFLTYLLTIHFIDVNNMYNSIEIENRTWYPGTRVPGTGSLIYLYILVCLLQ